MKITLYKYIINEIWPSFAASLLVTVFVILATRLMSITELIVNRGVHVGHVGRMILYLLPDIIEFALPAAILMAVVAAFLRLSSDNEMISLKACGISLYQMMPPVLVLSFVGLLVSAVVGTVSVPWGNRAFKDLVFEMAQSKADLGIRERIFCEPFDEVVFYVNSFSSQERVMKNVFVVDRRDKNVTNTIVAEEGRIRSYPNKRLINLHFLKGTVFITEKDLSSARTIGFNSYDMNIGLKDIMAKLASRKKAPKEMSIKELKEQLKKSPENDFRYNEMLIEILEKASIPIAVFLMGIIGVPLGAQIRSRERSAGVGVSLVVFLSYYICLAGMRSICETGLVSPWIGVWVPDLFLGFACICLFRRVANERPINFWADISSGAKGLWQGIR